MFFQKKNTEQIIPDADLISKYRFSHDADYVAELFNRYLHLIYGTCLKYLKNEADAEDMSMSIFEKLLVDLKKHDIQHFPSWLHMVVKNQCLMSLRKQTTAQQKISVIPIENVSENMESVGEMHLIEENQQEKEHLLQGIETALPKLNEPQRVCIDLFYLQNKTYQEVAEQTGYTINQVKSNIQNGKRNLKLFLEGNK